MPTGYLLVYLQQHKFIYNPIFFKKKCIIELMGTQIFVKNHNVLKKLYVINGDICVINGDICLMSGNIVEIGFTNQNGVINVS